MLDLIVREVESANNTAGSAIGRIANFVTNGDGGVVYAINYVPNMGDATTLNNQAVYLDRGGTDLAPLLVLRCGDRFDHDADAETADADIANLRISTTSGAAGSTGGYGRAINAEGEVLLNIGFTGSAGLFVLGTPPPEP